MLGLWHGAAWTFGFFGVFHGLAIWAYYYTKKHWDRMNWIVQIVLMFQIACVGWLIFRATSMQQAGEMFLSIFTNFSLAPELGLGAMAGKFIALSAILFIVQIFQDWKGDTLIVLKLPPVARYPFFVLLVSLMLVYGDFTDRPFIYFQF